MVPWSLVVPHGFVGSRYGEHHRRFLGNQFVGVARGSFGQRGCLLERTHQSLRQTQLPVGGESGTLFHTTTVLDWSGGWAGGWRHVIGSVLTLLDRVSRLVVHSEKQIDQCGNSNQHREVCDTATFLHHLLYVINNFFIGRPRRHTLLGKCPKLGLGEL